MNFYLAKPPWNTELQLHALSQFFDFTGQQCLMYYVVAASLVSYFTLKKCGD